MDRDDRDVLRHRIEREADGVLSPRAARDDGCHPETLAPGGEDLLRRGDVLRRDRDDGALDLGARRDRIERAEKDGPTGELEEGLPRRGLKSTLKST